jgi:hypothetical protein
VCSDCLYTGSRVCVVSVAGCVCSLFRLWLIVRVTIDLFYDCGVFVHFTCFRGVVDVVVVWCAAWVGCSGVAYSVTGNCTGAGIYHETIVYNLSQKSISVHLVYNLSHLRLFFAYLSHFA